MTEDQARAVGAAWLAAGGGWRPGMLWRVMREAPLESYHGRIDEQRRAPAERSAWPDLRDPATLGAALAVVRERWGDPGMFARRSTSRGLWRVSGSDTRSVVEAETEAEALVAALEAAPKAGS